MKQVIIGIIKLYQKFLSRDTGWLAQFYPKRTCRFYPTCSQYTIEAIEEYGVVRGIWLGSGRISRCHPWNKGGVDRVPKRNELKFKRK